MFLMSGECDDLSLASGAEDDHSRKMSSQNSKQLRPNHDQRLSAGKQSSLNAGAKVLPNYLRASTGSCHDFCKYGRKQAAEVKMKHPSISKKTKKPSSDMRGPTTVSGEKKMTVLAKIKPSHRSKTNLPEPSEMLKREVVLTSSSVSSRKYLPSDNKTRGDANTIDVFSSKGAATAKSEGVAIKSVSSLKTSMGSNITNNISTGKMSVNVTTRSTLNKPIVAGVSSSSSRPSTKAAGTRYANRYKTVKTISPRVDPMQRERSNQSNDVKAPKNVASLLNARKHKKSVKLVNSSKDQSKIKRVQASEQSNDDDQVQEKTLHVVQTETKNTCLGFTEGRAAIPYSLFQSSSSLTKSPSLPTFQKDEQEEVSKYTDSEELDSFAENDNAIDMEESASSACSDKKTSTTLRMVITEEGEDNRAPPVKVKFRMGKVIAIKSENNGPRRLTFRRGRTLGLRHENQVDTRIYLKRRELGADAIGDIKPGLEKVTLRHQHLQGKKDDNGLFNNVIEETASKLVESRKSKVKALVGAFETVISLQDR